ncbi:hypothetical protein ACLB2K_019094 [Fragaria x ananassa]
MATYRALLSLKSSLDDPRREQPLTLADLTLSNLTLAENNLSPSPISPSPRTTSPVPSRLRSPLSPLSASSTSPTNVFNRTFPPELSNLTNLRVLDLYNNNLTGVLPVSEMLPIVKSYYDKRIVGCLGVEGGKLLHLHIYLPS